MEEHIDELLVSELSFTFAWGSLGKGVALPRAVITRVGGLREMHTGGTGLMQGRLQIDCYGGSYPQALDASREVRAALEGYRGGPVQGVFLQAVRDGSEEDAELLHRVSLSFSITYRE